MLDDYTMWKNSLDSFEDIDIYDNLDNEWLFIYQDGSERRLTIKEFKYWNNKYRSDNYLLPDYEKIIKVFVPKSETEIESNFFENFISLKEVVLHVDIVKIGESAFYHCNSLEKINFQKSLKYIGALAFSGCESLEKVNFPNNLNYIGIKAFCGCSSLKKVSLLNICEIGHWAFVDSGLQEFIIKGEIEKISFDCICGCDNLRKLIIPYDCISGLWPYFLFNGKLTLKNALLNNECSITIFGNSFAEFYEYFLKIKLEDYNVDYINNKSYLQFNKNFTLTIQSDNLTWFEKLKLKKLLNEIKLKNVVFAPLEGLCLPEKNECIVDRKETLNVENMNIGIGEENKKLLDDINKLISNLSLDSKKVILDKVKKAIDIYNKSVKEERPILDLNNESVFSFNDKVIGNADLDLRVELLNIKSFLEQKFKTLELLSKLEGYRKILESTVEKSTDEDNTIEGIINNIVYLASQLDENNRKNIINQVNSYLDKTYDCHQKELKRELDDNIKLQFKEELEPKVQLNLNLSNYLDVVKIKYDNIIPYINLLKCLNNKEVICEYVESDTIEGLVNNIRYVLLQISNTIVQEDLIKSFNRIIDKYINKIKNIISGDVEEKGYQEFEILFRKDLQLFLEKLTNYMKLGDLSNSFDICLKLLKEKEVSQYKDTVEILFIKDILDTIEKNSFTNEEKEKIIIKLNNIINEYIFKVNSTSNKNDIKLELYKKLYDVKFKVDNYILESNRYNKLYSNNEEYKKLIKI